MVNDTKAVKLFEKCEIISRLTRGSSSHNSTYCCLLGGFVHTKHHTVAKCLLKKSKSKVLVHRVHRFELYSVVMDFICALLALKNIQ